MSARVRIGAALAVVFMAGVLPAAAQAKVAAAAARPTDNYDELFERYLREARAESTVAPEVQQWAWMSGLSLDLRARNVNDLITIRVVESITGSGTADSSLNKASDAGVGVPSLFGIEKKLGPLNPASLAATSAKTDFKGGGSTNRAGTLSAQMTARVSDVLPNGDLVVEGVREIEINGDRQIVVLTGVVRRADVAPGNEVLSTRIGQLRIRYFGRGLMKDNLKPGWLLRVLNKVF